ncbi:hypothetical protein [Luteimonas sp. MHLX1A]|uniref:hypothetical protein n=1 Tax=Alterluteimonas muca TaxID=2878684 RepID=UPI001E554EE1|nr:hypothetical protein [Luteimonas sp. MHLX1A]MCD9046012.1 hypothetical protein [Luteimonas sp. MHLX1A]
MGRLLILLLVAAGCALPASVAARTAEATIQRVETAVAQLHGVRVQLHWPQGAEAGELRLQAERVESPTLGYVFRDLDWRCPLRRPGTGAWGCDGPLRAGNGSPVALAVALDASVVSAGLRQGAATLALHRDATSPDLVRIDLTRVPLAWATALIQQAAPTLQPGRGTLDGRVDVHVATAAPLRIGAALHGRGLAFDSDDGAFAGEGIDLAVDVDYRQPGAAHALALRGTLRGANLLLGAAYLELPSAPIALTVDAVREQPDAGWRFTHLRWDDGAALRAEGAVALGADASLRAMDLRLHSDDASLLPPRYLSGWLGVAGLPGLTLAGTVDAHVRMVDGALAGIDAGLRGVDIADGRGRFAFAGLDGDLRISEGAPVDSALSWRGGRLQAVEFGPATLPFRSVAGRLDLRGDVAVEMLDGQLRFSDLSLLLPARGQGMRIESGLAVEALRLDELASAFGWPAFAGTLSGEIPRMRYADQRLDFDGGLAMHVFDGEVRFGSLALERPFGVAPSLSADIELEDLDLTMLTGVFDIGQIDGRLHGRFDGLRLVDWQLAAFDGELHTERRRGVRQRISQRAVQDISSVGDASFAGSLQAQLIGLFDDFRYRRIGISCRLRNEVCEMGGLRSAGNTFTIVEGSGLPRLDVVGHNRNVDWPTLVERVAAAVGGDVAPVVE